MEQANIDLSSVARLPNVEYLWVWGPRSFDLAPLGSMTTLRELTLTGLGIGALTPVANTDALRDLKQLEKLTLGSLHASDLAFVGELKNLSEISIGMMPVSNINALRGLTSLRSVSLDLTSVVDISALLDLPALTSLSVLRTPARSDVLTELEHRGVKVKR